MSQRVEVAVIAVLITAITGYAISGNSWLSGPVLLALDDEHGLHLEDVFALLAWLVCMVACRRLWRHPA